MKLSFFAKLLGLLFIGYAVVYIIDPLDPSTISTPFLLGIILMGLSLRQSTTLVLASSLIYSALTVDALILFHETNLASGHIDPHPYFWLFQRTGLFLVVCSMAIYLAHYRTSAEQPATICKTFSANYPFR